MNIKQFLDTLPIMGMGMAGIFIVTFVIILTVVLLNKLTAPKNKKDKSSNDSD